MQAIREQIIERFSLGGSVREAPDDIADALYALLYRMDLPVCVDGWNFFRIVSESDDQLHAVGLMTLLPVGSAPIELRLKATDQDLTWSVRVGRQDQIWESLSESKRWKGLYLYASGDSEAPIWNWEGSYEGRVHNAVA